MSKADELRTKLAAAKTARLADDGFVPQPRSQFSNGYSTREDAEHARYKAALEKMVDFFIAIDLKNLPDSEQDIHIAYVDLAVRALRGY